MTRFLMMGVLAGILTMMEGCGRQSDSSVTQPQTKAGATAYFRAKHGFDGGLCEMLDLTKRDGFDAIHTLDEAAKFASEVPGAVGFTAHPRFENGSRYAKAIMWYTGLSSTESSWALYLFDKKEALKNPGDSPRAEAVAAAEARISARMDEARRLIAAGGTNGVKLVGDYDENKVAAQAILRLGGRFEHTDAFTTGHCGACRSVISGGNPSSCGLDVQNQKHWNCCGATNQSGYCEYWKKVNAMDTGR